MTARHSQPDDRRGQSSPNDFVTIVTHANSDEVESTSSEVYAPVWWFRKTLHSPSRVSQESSLNLNHTGIRVLQGPLESEVRSRSAV